MMNTLTQDNQFCRYQLKMSSLRRATSIAIAVLLALVAEYYFALTHGCWIPVTVILTMQLSLRADVRQVFLRFFCMLITVFVLSEFKRHISSPPLVVLILVSIFVLAGILHCWQARNNHPLFLASLVGVLALLMLAPFSNTQSLFARLHDIAFGGCIAVLATIFVCPLREDVEFRAGVIPVLIAYKNFMSAIQALLFNEPEAPSLIQQRKQQVERVMRNAFFPAWVYEVGFNPTLREGQRHFLLRSEQVAEVLFAFQQTATHVFEPDLMTRLQPQFRICFSRAMAIMDTIISRLELGQLDVSVLDFVDDIDALKALVKSLVVQPLDFIEGSQDYIKLQTIIYQFKDLQTLLIKLAEALR